MANGPLTAEQVLDELEFLATVEHALIVEYLSVCCALGHEAADTFEQRLLDASNRSYGLVLALLRERFAPESVSSGLSVPAMESLDQINRLLVQRGLLPPFATA